MPCQIHKNVNLICTDLVCDGSVAFSQRVIPVISKLADSLGHFIGFLNFRIAENLHLGLVMRPEQGFCEIRTGMAAKIRRHIAHAETPSRCFLIGVRRNLSCQGRCMLFVPHAMLFKQPFGCMS